MYIKRNKMDQWQLDLITIRKLAKEKYGEGTLFDFYESGPGGEIFKYTNGKKIVLFSFSDNLSEIYEYLGTL